MIKNKAGLLGEKHFEIKLIEKDIEYKRVNKWYDFIINGQPLEENKKKYLSIHKTRDLKLFIID